MFLKQVEKFSNQNNAPLWIPSRTQLAQTLEAALKPFGDFPVQPVDSFNIKASNIFLNRVFKSKDTGAVLSFRVPQNFVGLLSECTRLQGQALLSPFEAMDCLAARFFGLLKAQAESRGTFFPQDWSHQGFSLPAGEPAQAGRMLASLSLVEIRLWK